MIFTNTFIFQDSNKNHKNHINPVSIVWKKNLVFLLDRISLEYKEIQGNTKKNGGRRGGGKGGSGVGGRPPFFLVFPYILKKSYLKKMSFF